MRNVRQSFNWKLWAAILIFLHLTTQVESQCFLEDAVKTNFKATAAFSANGTLESQNECKIACGEVNFPYAAILKASFCFCGTDISGLATSTSCSATCADGSECGGEDSLTVIETGKKAVEAGSIIISTSIEQEVVLVGNQVTVVVNASGDYAIYWGDGSTPTLADVEHAYNLPGEYVVTAFLEKKTRFTSSTYFIVHDSPVYNINCPTMLEIGVPYECNVTSYRQGYDYILSWNITNSTFTETFLAEIPSEEIGVYGTASISTDTLQDSDVTSGTLIVLPKTEDQIGGQLVRIKGTFSATGSIAVYAITPSCSSGEYCGISGKCREATSCLAHDNPLTCSNFCPTMASCKASCTSDVAPGTTYGFKLLAQIEVTATDFDHDIEIPSNVPIGTQLAVGCAASADCPSGEAKLQMRALGVNEENETRFDSADNSFSSSQNRHIIQLVIRSDVHIDLSFNITCTEAAPYPKSEVPTPYSETTEIYVFNGSLQLEYRIYSILAVSPPQESQTLICQEEILEPIVIIRDIWIKYGEPYENYTIYFTQGSPIFTVIDFGDGTMFYDYMDKFYGGWNMSLTLNYTDEGVFLLLGNSSNALGFVLFNATIHVVPPVTDTWTGVFECTCLDITDGFNLNLNFPSADHPPWNATFNATYVNEDGNTVVLFDEFLDFGTYGANGAAVPLLIERNTQILKAGTYNVTIFLENEVSFTTFVVQVVVEEALRNISGIWKQNYSGEIVSGMDAENMTFLADHDIYVYPSAESGIPDMWRIVVNETNEVFYIKPSENFTLNFPEEGTYTLIISGNNSVQGWVDSEPITITIEEPIRGVNGTLKWEREKQIVDGVGPDKNVFMGGNPIFIYPFVETGHPDKWILIIIETGESYPLDASQNFTTIILPEGNYTLIVKGYNPIQGWVESEPIRFIVEEALSNITGTVTHCNGSQTIEGMGPDKNIFLAGFPLCINVSRETGTPEYWKLHIMNETYEDLFLPYPENIFNLTLDEEGNYTLIVSANNSIQGWVDSKPITIIIIKPITEVNATLKWEREGLLVDGVGPDKNTYMSFIPIHIFPDALTGTPYKWRLIILDDGKSPIEISAEQNFTASLPQGNYTVIVSGFNPIQGWVHSEPIPIIVEEAISNVTGTVKHCNGSETIEGMGPDKNVFIAGFPLCIYPNVQTGMPFFWKVESNETDYLDELPFTNHSIDFFNTTSFTTEGTYTLFVSANNSVQGWVRSRPITIIIEDPITDVNATLKWVREGVLVDGVGPHKNTYMSFIPIHIFPESMTGHADKWRLIILDDGKSPIEISAGQNFTSYLPQGNYTVIVSGFNPIQGWVHSEPIPIIVEEAISNVTGTVKHCNGSETIEGMGPDKNVFIAGFPLCVYPNIRTGTPYNWKIFVNETSYEQSLPFKNVSTDFFNLTTAVTTEGTYNLIVSANNSIQGWVDSFPITIIIEDPITEVSGTVKLDSGEGGLVDGTGAKKNVYLAHNPIMVFPACKTGYADKWRLIVIDDGQPPRETNSAAENFTLTSLPTGNYTLIVSGFNPIQGWVDSEPMGIMVEESLSGVSGTFKWENEGELIDGMGDNRNVFMANKTIHVYPTVQTGEPQYYKIRINETSGCKVIGKAERPANENFTIYCEQEGEYTLFISAKNSLQGWVESMPLIIGVANEIQGFVLKDNNDITKEGEEKVIIGTFEKFTPMSCILVDFGDGSTWELYGDKEVCDMVDYKDGEKYEYKGTDGPFTAPVYMKHVYQEKGTYNVMAYASDNKGNNQFSEISIMVDSIPCTMPVVEIVDGVRIIDSSAIPEIQMSFFKELTTNVQFKCEDSYTFKRTWEAFQVDPKEGIIIRTVTVKDVLSSWNMSTIVIPPRFLSEGLYKLKHTLEVFPSPDKALKRSDYTYLRIIPSPLRAIVIAGSAMRVKRGLGQFVHLEPTLSYDPDYPEDEGMNKTLSCRQIAPNPDAAEGCLNANAAEDALSPEDHYLDTLDFVRKEGTFEIRLDVDKGSRTSFTTLTIEIVLDPLPIMQITCMRGLCIETEQGLYFSPNKRLALTGSCLDYCGIELSYSWLITSENGEPVVISDVCGTGKLSAEGSVIEMREDCEEAYLTPRNTSAIAVSRKFFEDNPNVDEFVFTVTGTTEKGYEGSTQLRLKKNKPPACGKCELYPPTSAEKYPVFCNNPNWVDPEGMGISSYTYYYFESSLNGPVKKTVVSTIKHSLELTLPSGSYELFVEISDVLGGTTNHSIGIVNVTTTKDPDPEAWLDLAAKDKAELWMKLMQYPSIRDTAKNYSLNPEDIRNMTVKEIEDRIRKIANLNTLASKLLLNTSSYMTMEDVNAGSSILQNLMSGVFNNELSSQTWDMNGIDNVIKILAKMNSTIPGLNVSSPGEYLPYMPNYLDIMSASLVSIGNNMAKETSCPPTDMDEAPYKDYDLGPISIDTIIPDNQEDMYCNNVKDSIKYISKSQIDSMFNILHTRINEILRVCVTGETFRCTSPNGASLVLSKIKELVLKGGLNITAKSSSRAGVMFPPNFCPSMYKMPDTDCNQELAIKCIVWPCITHMYPDTTKVLSKSTKILDLSIIINEDIVAVKNESNPIRMDIPRELVSIPEYNDVNATSELNRHIPFVYHSFNVTNEKSSITIEIRSLGSQEDLNNVVLLLDYNDTMPTPTKYWTIKKVTGFDKDENDTYKYFISSDENENRTGRFFAAIAKLDKSFENVDDFENLTFSKSDFVKNFDLKYSFSAYTSGCYFFDELSLEWSGRDLYVESASPDNIKCATHHLTPFGFGFTPTINSIDFEFIFSNAGFMDNLTIYVVLIVLACLFIFMMIWAFFKDRKDIERRGAIPLPDNKPDDKYLYELNFRTGPDDQASTDSNIYIILSGECGETEVRLLPPANNRLYRRFEMNTFVMTTPKPLGKLNYLRVFHDNSGEPPLDGWQLEMVVVRDLQRHEKYIFDTNDWLAFYRGDGKIDKTFNVYEGKDEKTFTQNMYVRGNRAANEDHMWFSIFLRSTGSRYDRKERVTVSFAFLFLSMLIDAVWYDMAKESSRDGNFNLGPFTFSLEQLLTGLCIVCVIFPVMYLVALIFKRARPRNLKKCRAIESIQKQRIEQRNMEKESALEDDRIKVQIDQGRSPKPKDVSQVKCIPWWTRIFAWIFVLASIGVSAFFVWSYGILWNETKTARWFSSFILTFFISILVAQWVKVAVISLISATCCKEDLTAQDIDCDEELPALKQNEEWKHVRPLDPTMRKKVHRVIGVDIENKETKSIQERLQKEYQIGHVLRAILVYCIFLAIVLTLVNGRTDYNAFLFQEHMTQVFIKDGVLDYDFEAKVKTSNEFWLWAKSILTELRAQNWYNDDPPYGLRGFLNDRASRMMGYPIFRQVRTKRYNCEVPSPADIEIEHCSGVRNTFREEEQTFCVGWIFNETFPGSCNWEEFQYKTAGELKTYPYTGKLGIYGGGGYIIRLNGYQEDLANRLDQLQQNNWIDKNTRAVFLEFSVYNANVNLFCMCTVLCEFIDGGGLMPKWRFEPVRLIKDTGVKGLITTICELGFAAATIFFTFRELWELKKTKCQYFMSYWNLAELCIVIISYLAIGMYIYRSILTQEALDEFDKTNGNGYVRMDSAAFIDQIFVYAAAAVVFFSTLKLIKLLQFNNRFNMLGLTIKGCWEDLKMFFVVFAIIFFAFSCLFFFMFTAHLEEFAKIISAIQTSFQMMMGKFEFEAMKNINFFSPLLFFVFSVINSMILINVMLTIILQAFATVKMDLANKQNKLDVINHVWISFKRFIRKEQLPKINVQPNFNNKDDRKYESEGDRKSDDLPDKVSMLLQYINDMYFDGRLDLNDPYAKKALMGGALSEKMLPFHDPTTFGRRTIKNSDEQ